MSQNESKSSDSQNQEQEVRSLLLPLFHYKWLIVFVAAACGTAAYFYSVRLPRIYAADCTLEYIPNPAQPLGTKIEGVANPFSYWSDREYFATQNLILGSRAVAERVVEKLGLQYDDDFTRRKDLSKEELAENGPPTVEQAAGILRGALTVNQERSTRLVHLKVEDRDPERAALLANTIAEEYMSKSVEDRLSSTTAALDWLGKQLDSLKQQLEGSELALHEFKEDSHALSISLEDRQNIVAADIQRYSEALTNARTARIGVESRLSALREANVADPLKVHAASVDESSVVSNLREEYSLAISEHDTLATEYGPAHPKMQAVSAKLDGIRRRLRAEVDGVISRAEVDLREVEAIERGLRGALADANSDGMALNLQEIEYRRLTRERDNTSELYAAIMERTAETDLARALRVDFAQVVDRATVPSIPIKPRQRVYVALGALFGLVLGGVLAFVFSRMDHSLRNASAVEAFGVTVLGLLPQIPVNRAVAAARRLRGKKLPPANRDRDLIVHLNPKSAVAECCRTVRTNLTFSGADHPYRALVITSASPREGKTTVSISLAISLAQSGKRILLVDTDLRRPRIHRAFNVRSMPGVTSILVGQMPLMEAVRETEIPGLSVLASGPIPPNPSELLHTKQFTKLIEDCKSEFDLVLFDSPPLAAVTDAAVIAPQVDGVLFVVHAERTTRDTFGPALRQLRDVSANVIGAVLNDVDLSSRRYGYGNYYYYAEGYSSDTKPDGDDRPSVS